MAMRTLHYLLVCAIASAAVLGPAARASLSCCGGTVGDSVCGSAAVITESVRDCSGVTSCCESVLPNQIPSIPDSPCSDSTDDDGPSQSEHVPCDDDCECSICGAISAFTNAVAPGGTMGLFAPTKATVTHRDQRLSARDQRFDLLRPPQD